MHSSIINTALQPNIRTLGKHRRAVYTSTFLSLVVLRLQVCAWLPFRQVRDASGKPQHNREGVCSIAYQIRPEMNLVETIDLYAIPCGYCQAGASQAMASS